MKYLAGVVTLRFDPALCTGCGRCWEVCPRGVFAQDGKKARMGDRDLCIECGACRQNCRPGAIEVRSGVGCASAILRGALTGREPSCGPDCGPGRAGTARPKSAAGCC
jgi:ferredoxin